MPTGSASMSSMSAAPLFNDEGKVRGGIAVILDISERKRGEAQQQVLLHELQHRVREYHHDSGCACVSDAEGHRPRWKTSPAPSLAALAAMARHMSC